MIPTFVNSAIGSRIPGNAVWQKVLKSDPMTNTLLKPIANPGLSMDKKTINKLYFVYRQPARQGHLTVKDGILYMKELFKNNVNFVDLRIVPKSL